MSCYPSTLAEKQIDILARLSKLSKTIQLYERKAGGKQCENELCAKLVSSSHLMNVFDVSLSSRYLSRVDNVLEFVPIGLELGKTTPWFHLTTNTQRFVEFVREVIHYMQKTLQVRSYHVKVLEANRYCFLSRNQLMHNKDQRKLPRFVLHVMYGYGLNKEMDIRRHLADISQCMSCYTTVPITKGINASDPSNGVPLTSQDCIFAYSDQTRSWLDGKARSMIVVTPIEHQERIDQLNDLALFEFFTFGAHQLQSNVRLSQMVVNVGDYQNMAHLHLKYYFRKPHDFNIFLKHHKGASNKYQAIKSFIDRLQEERKTSRSTKVCRVFKQRGSCLNKECLFKHSFN